MLIPTGLYHDDPAWPLIHAKISYWGITSSAGSALGTTLVCANLANEPDYMNQFVKILDGDAAGQVRWIVDSTTNATGTVTVDLPFTDSAGTAEQIVASIRFVIISEYDGNGLLYSTSTSAGTADGATITDTALATTFTVDDEPVGHTVRILYSTTASLIGQEREIWDYDFGTTTLYFNVPFTSQVPTATTYIVLRNRPSSGGGPGPTPTTETEEVAWKLAWYDDFRVADATADTERWSSEYISTGAADGTADINTTTANKLYVNITTAAVAAAEYGVRALWPNLGRKYFFKVDTASTVTSANTNYVWAGLTVSRGVAWDVNNYIRIYKRQSTTVESIALEYQLAGGGVITTSILVTTQDNIAFKIERVENVWRVYYSLTLAPHHYWTLGGEIEDPNNSMTDQTSTYLSVYNAEDAAGQRIQCNFSQFEHYMTLGNLDDLLSIVNTRNGSLAFAGYCPLGMAASTTTVKCPNLAGFENDVFNNHYYMWVIRNANSLGAAPDDEYRLITDYVSSTGVFTVNAFSANVEASDVVLVVHESIIDILDTVNGIYDIVNSILITSETGGTVTTTGTEQDLYINNIPAGAYKPIVLNLDCTNMVAGDAITLKCYKRVSATGNLIQDEELSYIGAQVPALKEITLSPTRHGIRTTITRIAAAAGGDKAYTWDVLVDA